MKTYVIVTGILFGLLTVAHVARMYMEGGFAVDPVYIGITALTAALCAWAFVLLRRAKA